MSESSDAKKQVRLDQDNYEVLIDIQAHCDWPVTLQVLANYAMKNGFARTRQTFQTRKTEKK